MPIRLPPRSALAFVLAFLPQEPAQASTNIQPPMVTLNADNPVATLTIGNERGVPAGYEIEALGWDQTPTGEVILGATPGIRVEPTSAVVPANGRIELKVTALEPAPAAGQAEKVYRLRVRERADREREAGEEQVQVLAVITLPVFQKPPHAEPRTAVETKPLADGRLDFAVVNGGTEHAYVREVAVSGRDKTGREVFAIRRPGWYVLAGGRLEFTARLSAKDCRASKTVAIVATPLRGGDALRAETAVSPRLCGRDAESAFDTPGMAKLAP